jgi:HK97 gp10 family phage protein
MREFHSIASFVQHIATLQAKEVLSVRKGLARAAKIVESQAKSEIGHYQDPIANFPGWEELDQSTKDDRVSKGFTENDPLLRNGKLRDSIHHDVDGLEATIGSDSDIAVYQELGTDKIPPRPFLGTALAIKDKQIVRIIGEHAVGALIDGNTFSYRLPGFIEPSK